MQSLPFIDVEATGRKIDELRKEKGYSVKDIQETMGFSSPQAVYNWLWGQSVPSTDSLVILAYIFGVKLDDIIVIK